MMNSFYSDLELKEIGFKHIGENVKISRFARFYSAEKISIGNNVRIDDFCILSGKIQLGNYIHVAAYSSLFAGESGIDVKDYSNISSRCSIYGKSDDYSGQHMTNPMIDERFLGIEDNQVILEKHVIIGSGSVVLPGVHIGEGVAIGAMSLVNRSLDSFGIYAGIPCRYLRTRSKNVLELEKAFLKAQ